ncbi:MAG: serine/threonine protein kinase [Planctomycetales bacterium]|nr:serine/threonine protein kinase [Planctomycetales bacterium]
MNMRPPHSDRERSDDDCIVVDELAHEFANRLRTGERVTATEYAKQYPQHADEIHDLFPAIVTMERLTRSKKQSLRQHDRLKIQQLGDYRIIGEIARGGMGIVYEAEQVSLGRRVAMKVLPAHSLRSKNELLRFQREARTAARLHHTNVVPVFGVGEQDGYHYIVMQYIEGVGIDEVLNELRATVLGQSADNKPASSARSNYARRNADALITNRFSLDSGEPRSASKSGRARAPDANAQTNTIANATSEVAPHKPSDQSTSNASGAVSASSDTEADLNSDVARRKLAKVTNSIAGVNGYRMLGAEYWRSVAALGVQAAEALAYAHSSRTLHRDVKPGNLLLDIHGNLWIADFGLAKAIEAENVTWTGNIVGTLSYMAPERFRDETDERSDVYGLGLTLYELLTLKRAFDGSERASLIHRVANDPVQPPRKLNANIPTDLETIVLKATAKDPADRYQSAKAMAEDLRCFLNDSPISARRSGPIERMARWCRRNKTVAALTATVATLLVVSSTLALIGYAKETKFRRNAEATSQLAFDVFDRLYDELTQEVEVPRDLSYANGESEGQRSGLDIPLSKDAATALASLLEFYDSVSQQSSSSDEVRTRAMIASRRVGDIQYRLSEFDKASFAYQRALELAQHISPELNGSVEIRIEHARILNGIGKVHNQRHQIPDSTAAHKKAIELLEGIEVADAQYERALAYAHLHRIEKRPEYAHRATDILEELCHSVDPKPQYRFALAQCLSCRFSPNKQCDTRDRAVEILEELVCDYPDSPEYRYELGQTYSGSFCCAMNPKSMEDMQLEAKKITERFDEAYLNVPSYVELRSTIFERLGRAVESQGRREDAVNYYQEAINRLRLLSGTDGGNAKSIRTRYRLAWLYVRTADALAKHHPGEAGQSYDAAIELLLDLVNEPMNRFLDKSDELLTDAQRGKSLLQTPGAQLF